MMSRNRTIILLAACVIAALLIAGCTQSATTTPATTAAPTAAPTTVAAAPGAAGMANPASVNCGKVGGKTEIKTGADGGQYGMCSFTNGTSCEEWALFRGEGCKTGVTAAITTAAPASVGLANPASVNCGKVGGKTEIKTGADGGQYGMCSFTNGTSCEEWALFRGEGCKAGVTVAVTNVTTTAAPVK